MSSFAMEDSHTVSLTVEVEGPADAAAVEDLLRGLGVDAENPQATAEALHMIGTPDFCRFETRTNPDLGVTEVEVRVDAYEVSFDILLTGLLIARDLGREVFVTEKTDYVNISSRGCGSEEHRVSWVSAIPEEYQGYDLESLRAAVRNQRA